MTTYYIDANRGSDGNGGLSPSDAWQNLSMIPSVLTPGPGDRFLLGSDSRFTPPHNTRCVMPAGATGNKKNDVRISKFVPAGADPAGKPTVVWNRETVVGDWSETATPGVWVYANVAGYQFTNSCLIRLNDTWDASCVDTLNTPATIAAGVGGAAGAVPGRFYATGTNLWLYSAPGINPVTYFGKVVVSPAASGYFGLSSGRGWITIEDIHFEDTGCGVLCYSGTSAEVGFRVRRISGRRVSNLIGANADAGGALRAWIHDCDIQDFGALAIISSCNGDGIRQLEIYDNRIDDGVRCWAQGGIYITARSPGFAPKVYRNHVSRCRWGTRDKNVDGCGIYIETKSDNALVFDNVITDSYCAFQDNSGRKATFMGNVVLRCRLGMRVTDQALVGLMDHHSYNNTFIVGDPAQVPTEFGGTQGQQYTGFWMYKVTGAFKVTAKNNVICDVTGGNPRAAFGIPDSGGTFALDGNWLYGYANDQLTASTNGTPVTLSKLGTADPRGYLNADGSLSTLVSSNPLNAGGAYVAGLRLAGSQRPTPSRVPIGASMLAAA